ncbi:MAG: DUF305 domain-containing protein [Ilumatobacter sp.]
MTYDPNPSESPMVDTTTPTAPAGESASPPIEHEGHDDSAGKGADSSDSGGGVHMSYTRFGAMIATSTLVMFVLMYLNTYAWDHVRFSETRAYMAVLMGGVMAIIMLGFMLGMYRSTKMNIGIFVLAIAVFAGSLALVRSQVTVQDGSWMRAMIPHHSIAILTSERAEIDDARVCELAKGIIEAQQREIAEMEWLLDDIAENGTATTAEAAADRAVPEFDAEAIRDCP